MPKRFACCTWAVAMNDSPAGLLAWLVDMCRSFTVGEGDVESALSRDQLLANVSVYWFTGTIASACPKKLSSMSSTSSCILILLKPGSICTSWPSGPMFRTFRS